MKQDPKSQEWDEQLKKRRLQEEGLLQDIGNILKTSSDNVRENFNKFMGHLFFARYSQHSELSVEYTSTENIKKLAEIRDTLDSLVHDLGIDSMDSLTHLENNDLRSLVSFGWAMDQYTDDIDEAWTMVNTGIPDEELRPDTRSLLRIRHYVNVALDSLAPRRRTGRGGARRSKDTETLLIVKHTVDFYVDVTGAKPGTSVDPTTGEAKGPLVQTVERVLKFFDREKKPEAVRSILRRHFLKADPGS